MISGSSFCDHRDVTLILWFLNSFVSTRSHTLWKQGPFSNCSGAFSHHYTLHSSRKREISQMCLMAIHPAVLQILWIVILWYKCYMDLPLSFLPFYNHLCRADMSHYLQLAAPVDIQLKTISILAQKRKETFCHYHITPSSHITYGPSNGMKATVVQWTRTHRVYVCHIFYFCTVTVGGGFLSAVRTAALQPQADEDQVRTAP